MWRFAGSSARCRRQGRTTHPRRAHEARFHRVGGDGIALHAPPARRARPSEALDRVLAQPRGRHRRDGSVHCADGRNTQLAYGFFIIEHGRRHIVHFNATFHPSAAWVIQQLREAFPYDTAPRYLVFDRDSIFSAAVVGFIKAMGTKPVRTSFRSPWQNGTAERRIGSCRREILEHVVVFGERHLVRLVRKLHHLFPMKPPIAGSRRHCSRAPLSPSSNGCGASSVRINNDEGTHAGSAWTSSSRFRRSICVVFLTEWRDDYNQVRPQSSLGPSVPDPASDLPSIRVLTVTGFRPDGASSRRPFLVAFITITGSTAPLNRGIRVQRSAARFSRLLLCS